MFQLMIFREIMLILMINLVTTRKEFGIVFYLANCRVKDVGRVLSCNYWTNDLDRVLGKDC